MKYNSYILSKNEKYGDEEIPKLLVHKVYVRNIVIMDEICSTNNKEIAIRKLGIVGDALALDFCKVMGIY